MRVPLPVIEPVPDRATVWEAVAVLVTDAPADNVEVRVFAAEWVAVPARDAGREPDMLARDPDEVGVFEDVEPAVRLEVPVEAAVSVGVPVRDAVFERVVEDIFEDDRESETTRLPVPVELLEPVPVELDDAVDEAVTDAVAVVENVATAHTCTLSTSSADWYRLSPQLRTRNCSSCVPALGSTLSPCTHPVRP